MIYQRGKSFENDTCCIYRCRSKYTRALCVWVAEQIQWSKSLGCNKTVFLAFCRLHSNKRQEQLWKDCQCIQKSMSKLRVHQHRTVHLRHCQYLWLLYGYYILQMEMQMNSPTEQPLLDHLCHCDSMRCYCEQCFRKNNRTCGQKAVFGDHFYRPLGLTSLSEELTPVWSTLA